MMLQPRLVVGGEREHQRALRPQLDVDAGRLLELRREGRPAPLALAPERHQRFLARLGLGASRQHPGGSVAGAATGDALVEDRHRGAARGQPPGDAQTDHAGTDDGDARRLGTACGMVRSTGGSLRWNDPDRSAPRKYYQGFRLSNTPMGAHWRQRVFRYAVKPSRASSVPPAALRPAFHVCPWGNELPPATTRSGPR